MLNLTGKPNPQFYVLGRGKVLLAINDTTTGLPDTNGYRHLGNAPAFATTLEIEEFTHRSSLSGFSEVDARAVTSREIGLSFSLDEISFDNLALFYNGSTESLTNPAVAGVTVVIIVPAAGPGVKLGRWYQLLDAYDGTGDPVSLIASPAPAFRADPSGTPVPLVEGTDYELDLVNGMVFLLSTASNIADGDEMDWSVAAQATAPATIARVKALDASNVEYSIQFFSINPLNSDEEVVYEFHRVNLSADGDLNLIQENDASVAGFTGTALKNASVGANGATVTIRGV